MTGANSFTVDFASSFGGALLLTNASFVVTASGKFVTGKDAKGKDAKGKDIVYSASCSSVLVPDADEAGAGRLPYRIYLYFPPKAGKFDGYADEISLVWNGTLFKEE